MPKAGEKKDPNSTTTDYIVKRIPRDLWDRAQAKAAHYKPLPLSMRHVLIELLDRWVGPSEVVSQAATPAPKPRKVKPPTLTALKIHTPECKASRVANAVGPKRDVLGPCVCGFTPSMPVQVPELGDAF